MKKILSIFTLLCFLLTGFGIHPVCAEQGAYINTPLQLPKPGVMVHLSPPMNPPMLKGIKVHTDNPFRFDFILDTGDVRNGLKPFPTDLKNESSKLIKYFLASLTTPEKDLWVNLSPYEKDRIVPESFGQTEMGRDLLAQDYMLKQITASLIYPEDKIGKKFWKRIYEEAAKKYGTTNIPVNTFNKVWIVPEKAVVYENAKAGTAYVVESKLKVMLEQDYEALNKNNPKAESPKGTTEKDTHTLGSQIIREVVIPELTKEINENQNFAQLRQVYNSLILATWYKKKIKDSILSQVYADKNKVQGINIDDPNEKEKIYQQYLQAFKKGVYNYIKEEPDPITQQSTPRKYFSGGLVMHTEIDFAQASFVPKSLDRAQVIAVDCAMARPSGVRKAGESLARMAEKGDSAMMHLPALANFSIPMDPRSSGNTGVAVLEKLDALGLRLADFQYFHITFNGQLTPGKSGALSISKNDVVMFGERGEPYFNRDFIGNTVWQQGLNTTSVAFEGRIDPDIIFDRKPRLRAPSEVGGVVKMSLSRFRTIAQFGWLSPVYKIELTLTPQAAAQRNISSGVIKDISIVIDKDGGINYLPIGSPKDAIVHLSAFEIISITVNSNSAAMLTNPDRAMKGGSIPATKSEIFEWIGEGSLRGLPSVGDLFDLAKSLGVKIYLSDVLNDPTGVFLMNTSEFMKFMGSSTDLKIRTDLSLGSGIFWSKAELDDLAQRLKMKREDLLALGGLKNNERFIVLNKRETVQSHKTLFEEVLHALEDTSNYSYTKSSIYVREVINDVIQMLFFPNDQLRDNFSSNYTNFNIQERQDLKDKLLKGGLNPNVQLNTIVLRLKGKIGSSSENPFSKKLFSLSALYVDKGVFLKDLVRIAEEYLIELSNVSRISSGDKIFPNYSKKSEAMISESTKSNGAMKGGPGGIDLTSNKFLKTQNQGEDIKFHLDPAQLGQSAKTKGFSEISSSQWLDGLQNAPGFTPVIINITPLQDLHSFLGIN